MKREKVFKIKGYGVGVSKLTVISGHLGSGKTEFSLNYTTNLKARHPEKKVVLCDLDFVNPYFRSRRHKDELEKNGVTIITPDDREISMADIPSVSGRIRTALTDLSAEVILEVGGDEGAIVLGHLRQAIRERGFNHYMVLNTYRPDTDDSEKVTGMIKLIEKVSSVPITGIVLNNHLMYETKFEDVIDGYRTAAAMDLSATPVKYVCINGEYAEKAKKFGLKENEEWFYLRRFTRYAYEAQ